MESLKRRGPATKSNTQQTNPFPPSSQSTHSSSSSSSSNVRTFGTSKRDRLLQTRREIAKSKDAADSGDDSFNDAPAPSSSSSSSSADAAFKRPSQDRSHSHTFGRDPFDRGFTRQLSSASIFSSDPASSSSSEGGDVLGDLFGSSQTSSAPAPKRKPTTLTLPPKGMPSLVLPPKHQPTPKPNNDKRDTARGLVMGQINGIPTPAGSSSDTGEDGDESQTEIKRDKSIPKKVDELKACPFCERDMPSAPSPLLCYIMQPWLDRFHADEHISVTDTATSCARHEEEVDVIPLGQAQGWPRKLDWDKVAKRVESHKDALYGFTLNPERSFYYKQARDKKLYRSKSVLQTSEAISQTQAGYYGELGWERFRSILLAWLDHSGDSQSSPPPSSARRAQERWPLDQQDFLQRVQPLSTYDFIDLVLIPELTCLLINEDEGGKLTDEEARAVRVNSASYGLAVFPVLDDSMLASTRMLSSSPPSLKTASQPVPSKARARAASPSSPPGQSPLKRPMPSTQPAPLPRSKTTTTTAQQPNPPPKSINANATSASVRPRARIVQPNFLASRSRGYPPDEDDDFFNRKAKSQAQPAAPAATNKRVAGFDDLLGGGTRKPNRNAQPQPQSTRPKPKAAAAAASSRIG